MSLQVSIVVIGRNEGAHVARAIRSARREAQGAGLRAEVLYVDSGSTDGSPMLAIAAGARTHVLPRTTSNAAKARNRGAELARGRWVHFVDGDMTLCPRWLGTAVERAERAGLDALGGRIVERLQGASLWSRAFGLDWCADGHRTGSLGGAALWKRSSFLRLGGFDEELEVGEDPDLYRRALAEGLRVETLARDMVLHELGLRDVRDWWRRAVAVGRSAAIVGTRFQDRRLMLQRFAFPLLVAVAVTGALLVDPRLLVLPLTACLALLLRRFLLDRRSGMTQGNAWLHAVHVYAVKFPQLLGALRVLLARRNRRFVL